MWMQIWQERQTIGEGQTIHQEQSEIKEEIVKRSS
jgi:hypothetical protein